MTTSAACRTRCYLGLVTVLLGSPAHFAHAFPGNHPTNCDNCHRTPIAQVTTPNDGAPSDGFLTFGSNGNTLVKQSSSGRITIKNNMTNLAGSGSQNRGGGFSGSFPGIAAGLEFSGAASTIVGSSGYLTPQLSEFRDYTYTPQQRSLGVFDTAAWSFTPTNGFAAGTVPIINITLRGKGVAPQVSLDTSQASAGNVRLGTTSATRQIVVTNAGDGNQSGAGAISNLKGSAPALSGTFTSLATTIDLADAGSKSIDYVFSPAGRGLASTDLAINTTNGSTDGRNDPEALLLSISGTGVGPQFKSSIDPGATLDFGDVMGGSASRLLRFSNETLDPDLGELTRLTLLSLVIGGPDAALFSIANFAPGATLDKGASHNVDILFNAPGMAGARAATLTLTTDEGVALGLPGQQFQYSLIATAVPEPRALALLLVGLCCVGLRVWQRQRG